MLRVALSGTVATAFSGQLIMKKVQRQQQPFNGHLSRTTRVGQYQKKHSPAHTHPGQRTSFITFLHLQRSMASSAKNVPNIPICCKVSVLAVLSCSLPVITIKPLMFMCPLFREFFACLTKLLDSIAQIWILYEL